MINDQDTYGIFGSLTLQKKTMEIIKKISESEFHIITRMIAKENFTYIDHNFKLSKNKTIQNTYVIILSTNKKLDNKKILDYDFK